MAETKNIFNGFVGPSNKLSAPRFDCQRTHNMFVEINPLGAGKENQTAVLLSTPGLNPRAVIGTGPVRGIHTTSIDGKQFAVSGNKVFYSNNNFVSSTLIGTIGTSTGPVAFADNGSAASNPQVMLIDGTNGYTVAINNPLSTFATITDPNFYSATSVTFQDGYFILNKAGTGYFFISDINDVTFPELNEALKSGYGDNIVAVISNNRELYLLGEKTTEFWFNSGQSGLTPFQRIDGKFSNTGCSAAATVKKLSDTIFWMGPNEQGGAIIFNMNGGMPNRISNHAVELSLQAMSATDLSASSAWVYQSNGHFFYCLSVPNLGTTWCYDVSSGLWHERRSDVGDHKQGRHLAFCATFSGAEVLCGSYVDGSIYVLDNSCYTDNGQPILRLRASPHISAGLNNEFISLVQLDCQAGTGNSTGTEAAIDPKLTLRVSRDGGQTWGLPRTAALGKIGRYTTRQRWTRLGYGRDMVFEVSCSDPVSLSILSAWIDIEKGFA